MPHSARIFRFDWSLLHDKWVCFCTLEKAKSLILSNFFGLFPLFSIFFCSRCIFLRRRANPFPLPPACLVMGHLSRLAHLQPDVKSKVLSKVLKALS